MFRKSLKYILIALINFILLFVLFNAATYDVRLLLGLSGIVDGWFPLFIVFFGSLIGMGIMVSIMRKRPAHSGVKPKVIYAILLTFLLSGYYYLDYGLKTFERFYDVDRQVLLSKTEPLYELAHGFKAAGLAFSEYEELLKWKTFPEIPTSAENINFKYAYDGFLADYSFQLSYEVPTHVEIEIIEKGDDQFYQSQHFELKGNHKLVTYSEGSN